MLKTKTRPWDPAEGMDSVEEMEGYLNLALEDGDLRLFVACLSDVSRAQRMLAGDPDAGLGKDGLLESPPADVNPDFATVLKEVHALGFRLQVAAVSEENDSE